MIQKIVKIRDLNDPDSIKADLDYWLSKSFEERLAAVELTRRQYHGNKAKLQRTARVIQRTQG
jgi:hypothetical protein